MTLGLNLRASGAHDPKFTGDIQILFKETIVECLEDSLEAEMDDELGYSKYDYKNKDTDNS